MYLYTYIFHFGYQYIVFGEAISRGCHHGQPIDVQSTGTDDVIIGRNSEGHRGHLVYGDL